MLGKNKDNFGILEVFLKKIKEPLSFIFDSVSKYLQFLVSTWSIPENRQLFMFQANLKEVQSKTKNRALLLC